jgi:hypothetical protein
VARSSNVQRIRRPLTLRHLLRGLVFAGGLVGGVLTAWLVVPRSDLLAFDLGLVQGAAAGALIGLCLSVMIPLPTAPKGPAKPRPSGFDALVAALDAEDTASTLTASDASSNPASGAERAPDATATSGAEPVDA